MLFSAPKIMLQTLEGAKKSSKLVFLKKLQYNIMNLQTLQDLLDSKSVI